MIHLKKLIEETRGSSSLPPLEKLTAPSYLQASSLFPSTENRRESPLEDDPLCKFNLKETSEFVKAVPLTSESSSENGGLFEVSVQRRREKRMETLSTPGRSVFSCSAGNLSRRSVPSKWGDAEKWVISSSCHESPAHDTKPSEPSKVSRQIFCLQQNGNAFAEKLKLAEDKVARLHGVSTELLLKDKFTDNVCPPFPNFRFSNPTSESFLFKDSCCESVKEATAEVVSDVHHRNIGTAMTPLGSSTTTRCHTPLKSSSPARHNTPTNRSGRLVACNVALDISELKDCHFAKLEPTAQYDSIVSNWSSREEEEEQVSKSLRHFDIDLERKSFAESRVCLWEEEETTMRCIRYQREEAKVKAWLNLQSAKAEEQSRKLEVKIQKMRSKLEEKLMKRMTTAQRKAEELRAAAQLQQSPHILRASDHAKKMKIQYNSPASCGCFPCSNHL